MFANILRQSNETLPSRTDQKKHEFKPTNLDIESGSQLCQSHEIWRAYTLTNLSEQDENFEEKRVDQYATQDTKIIKSEYPYTIETYQGTGDSFNTYPSGEKPAETFNQFTRSNTGGIKTRTKVSGKK